MLQKQNSNRCELFFEVKDVSIVTARESDRIIETKTAL
jgi:hypothetical protein